MINWVKMKILKFVILTLYGSCLQSSTHIVLSEAKKGLGPGNKHWVQNKALLQKRH